MHQNHSFDSVKVRGDCPEEVRGLLRLLPLDTFQFAREFQRGLQGCGEDYCGQIGIYAKKEPLLGEKGAMLVIVNEHLFGDPTSSDDNPCLKVPDGATKIYLVPPRQSPLKKDHPFAEVQFDYRGARFFLGYELSDGARNAIANGIIANH